MKGLEVEPVVPGLLVVDLLKLLRVDLELDRHDGSVGDKHGVYTPAEPRDIELKVNPGGGTGDRAGGQIREGRAEHGKLQSPCGELLGGECVAVRGGKRRLGLLIAYGKKRVDVRGIGGGLAPLRWCSQDRL